MAKKSVLYVKKDSREFFVIAEPLVFTEKVPFVDEQTKEVLVSEYVNYKLFELKNGKKYKLLGFIENIKPSTPYFLRVGTPVIFNALKAIEYHNEWIFIIDKVYDC